MPGVVRRPAAGGCRQHPGWTRTGRRQWHQECRQRPLLPWPWRTGPVPAHRSQASGKQPVNQTRSLLVLDFVTIYARTPTSAEPGSSSTSVTTGSSAASDMNDTISSIQVPAALVAMVFEHADSGGGYGISADFLEDCADLAPLDLNDGVFFLHLRLPRRARYRVPQPRDRGDRHGARRVGARIGGERAVRARPLGTQARRRATSEHARHGLPADSPAHGRYRRARLRSAGAAGAEPVHPVLARSG